MVKQTALDSPRSPRQLLALIEQHKKSIAAHRDALRDLFEELESVLDSADRGVEHLESAIDALSEYL